MVAIRGSGSALVAIDEDRYGTREDLRDRCDRCHDVAATADARFHRMVPRAVIAAPTLRPAKHSGTNSESPSGPKLGRAPTGKSARRRH